MLAARGEGTPLVPAGLRGDASGGFWSSREAALCAALGLALAAQAAKTVTDDALTNTAELIAKDRGISSAVTTLLGAGTATYAVGKAIALFTSARLGGKTQLFGAMAVGTATSLAMCIGTAPALFGAWLVWRLASASVWPGGMSVLVNWVDPEHTGAAGSALGLSWEATHVVSGLLFSRLLADGADGSAWRRPFIFAACCCAAAALGLLTLKQTPELAGHRPRRAGPRGGAAGGGAGSHLQALDDADHPLDGADVPTALVTFVRSPRYVLMLMAAASGLVLSYLVLLAPTFAQAALGASASEASFVIVAAGLGTILGIATGGFAYDRAGRLGRAAVVLVLASGSILLGWLCLFSYTGRSMSVRSFCAFVALAGFCIGPLAYIPETVVSAELGGTRHAATATTLTDLVGVVASSAVSLHAGKLLGDGMYGAYVSLLALVSTMSGVFFSAWAVHGYYVEAGEAANGKASAKE